MYKGLKVLSKTYATQEARDLHAKYIQLVFVMQKYLNSGDDNAGLNAVKSVHHLYEQLLQLEPSGVTGELSQIFFKQTGDLLQDKASVKEIEQWLERVVKILRFFLNNGKPF